MTVVTTIMTKMKRNTSDYLCEQLDLHPVAPNFALCAICLKKAGDLPPKLFVRCVTFVTDCVK